MYLLPPGRYTVDGCRLESGICSELELGLLDFGASYTVILMEVRFLAVQVYVSGLTSCNERGDRTLSVCFVRNQVKL